MGLRAKNVLLSIVQRQFFVTGGDFFLFYYNLRNVDLRAKNVLLSIFQNHFLPKWSFCNRGWLRFFMHMKTHFSTIFFYIYLNLQINNIFKTARIICILFTIQISQKPFVIHLIMDGPDTRLWILGFAWYPAGRIILRWWLNIRERMSRCDSSCNRNWKIFSKFINYEVKP